MNSAVHSFFFRDSSLKKKKVAIQTFFVLEMIIRVKKSHYAMTVEGKKVENYLIINHHNLNGYLPIIPKKAEESFILYIVKQHP